MRKIIKSIIAMLMVMKVNVYGALHKNNINTVEEKTQMQQSMRDEAIEELEKEILFGFYDKEDLLVQISDMFYDEKTFDKQWLADEIETRLKKHQKESKKWEKPTDFERLVQAFDTLSKNGIVALHRAGYTRQDGEEDSREIIEELKKIGIQAKGFCYYHEQDLERVISEEKNLYIGYNSYNDDDTLAEEVAKEVVKTLELNGFKVNWNGSIETRIEIVEMDWKKTADGIDYYERVFRMMKNTMHRDR